MLMVLRSLRYGSQSRNVSYSPNAALSLHPLVLHLVVGGVPAFHQVEPSRDLDRVVSLVSAEAKAPSSP